MSTHTAVIYTRASSREQEQEGFSLDMQTKLLRAYAARSGFEVVRAFEDVETAKATGRKQFGEMVTFFKRASACRVLLVEKQTACIALQRRGNDRGPQYRGSFCQRGPSPFTRLQVSSQVDARHPRLYLIFSYASSQSGPEIEFPAEPEKMPDCSKAARRG